MAKDIYISPLFIGAYRYAQKLGADKVFILSAKHGLLEENDWISPYDETLNTKPISEIKEWANKVLCSLSEKSALQEDEYIFLAGEKYRKYLLGNIKHYSVPLQGLSIGKQLSFYKENA